MRVEEGLWDAAEVAVGLGWALAPMLAATVAVSVPMEEQENLLLGHTPTEEAMGLLDRVTLEDLVPTRATTPIAVLLHLMVGGPLQGRL